MSESACDAFKTAMTSALASPGPVDPPMELLRHLSACDGCADWFGAQDLVGKDATEEEMMERVAPLMAKLDEMEGDAPHDRDAALREEAGHRDAELLAVIERFLAKHPELAPGKHGIPMERYRSAFIFFHAVDALNRLMRHYHRRDDRGPHSFALREDGAVFIDGKEAIPLSSVRGEIREWIRDLRVVPEEEKTPDLGEALRREAAWSDDETCAKLVAWAVAAIRVKPDLMRNFRLTEVSLGSPQYLVFEEIRTKNGERELEDLWT